MPTDHDRREGRRERSPIIDRLIAGALAGEEAQSGAPRCRRPGFVPVGVGGLCFEKPNEIRLLLYDGEGPPRWVTLPRAILTEILRTLVDVVEALEQIEEPERRLWRTAQVAKPTGRPI